jgi:carbamoyltransferase
MKILGVSCYFHDSAAALAQDGCIVAAAEEERFTRRKHDSGFPTNAVSYCLSDSRTPASELDLVVFYDKPLKKLERALSAARKFGARAERLVNWHLSSFVHRESRLTDDIAKALGCEKPVEFCEHHLSHAASVFYVSPFEEAAILTVDGVGEWATTALYAGTGSEIKQLREIHYPHSVGLFYATMTAYLGFEVNEGEYKVMGLASCGRAAYEREMEELLTLHEDGSFRNNLAFFSYMYDDQSMFTARLVELLGPARHPSEPITARHIDIAASTQRLCERAIINLARSAKRETGMDHLCMAGGVAHNVVANSRVLAEAGFADVFIQPASGDSGGAIGAALYAYHQRTPVRRTPQLSYDTCLGPSFSNETVLKALEQFDAVYEQLDSPALFQQTARLLKDDFVVGWFQARMEFGPRALGCRSILANPGNPHMKDILNQRVKLREQFRPFAPAVLEEDAAEYFDHAGKSPFMLFCPSVKADKRAAIPSVTHVDGTARIQTVSRTANPRFHALITEFKRLTGVPMVINTSFNIRGEPIVCTPEDALKCFFGTEIDFLIIGDFVVSRRF